MRDDSGYNVRSLNVDGGASKSDFLMQFQADMLGCGIRRPESVEAEITKPLEKTLATRPFFRDLRAAYMLQ